MTIVKHTIKTNCKYCGEVFDSFNLEKSCPLCNNNMEDYFDSIKKHRASYPDATIDQISIELNIPMPIIKLCLKEERLLTRSNEIGFVRCCEMCKKPIHTGRYCFTCEIKAVRSEMMGRKRMQNNMENSSNSRTHMIRGSKRDQANRY